MMECGVSVIPVTRFSRGISPIGDLRTLLTLYSIIRKGRYDIVHCHSSKAGLLGRIAAKLAGVRQIYFTAHGWGFYNRKEYGWARSLMIASEKIGATCATKVICVSERVRQDAIDSGIAKPEKLVVVKNGISWASHGSREEVRRRLGVQDDAIVFGTVARLAHQKNPLLYLEAAKSVFAGCAKARFVVVGDGPLAAECRDYVRRNKMNGTVIFTGERSPEEARELLLGFDVFVMTSRFEGLPLTIIEAMFAGLPVVASDVGGVEELVSTNENGLLFESGDLLGLLERMEYLVDNPEERLRMGRAGRDFARRFFTAERTAGEYEAIYLNDLPHRR